MPGTCHTCGRSAKDRKRKAKECYKASRINEYDIDNSCNKHIYCGHCKLVCCPVCQGCNTRNCREAPICFCRRC